MAREFSHVLVVGEEGSEPATGLSAALTRLGVNALHATSCEDALELANPQQCDVVAVQVGPRFPQGTDLVGQLKEHGLPVVALATRYDADAVVAASRRGADTYITAVPRDLLQFIQETIDSSARPASRPATTLRVRELTVDTARREASVVGQILSLTLTQLEILTMLAQHPGQVLTAQGLAAHAHKVPLNDRDARELMRGHVSRLHRKILQCSHGEPYIVTRRGVGYMLDARSAPRATTASAKWGRRGR